MKKLYFPLWDVYWHDMSQICVVQTNRPLPLLLCPSSVSVKSNESGTFITKLKLNYCCPRAKSCLQAIMKSEDTQQTGSQSEVSLLVSNCWEVIWWGKFHVRMPCVEQGAGGISRLPKYFQFINSGGQEGRAGMAAIFTLVSVVVKTTGEAFSRHGAGEESNVLTMLWGWAGAARYCDPPTIGQQQAVDISTWQIRPILALNCQTQPH